MKERGRGSERMEEGANIIKPHCTKILKELIKKEIEKIALKVFRLSQIHKINPEDMHPSNSITFLKKNT